MDWKQEQKIIKTITNVAEEIQMIGQTLDEINGVSAHARNSKYELLQIIHLFKINNEEQEKKEQEDGEKEVIQHKDQKQEE